MYRASFFLKLVIITIIISIPIGCSKTHKGDTYLPKNQKPNIVLIVIDALRSDKLGCYGFNKNTSPEIDKIAEMSIVFKDVYSQCSWTRPSIGSLITSLYPRSLGIFKEKFDTLDDKFITLAEILKDNGYFTMGFTANPNINSVFNFDQGFDFYSDSNAVWEWMNRKKGEIFASKKGRSFLPKSQPLFNSIIEKVKENLKKPFYLQINVMEVHTPALMRKEYKVMALNKVKKHSKNFRNKRLLQKVVNYETAIQQISFDLDVFISRLKKTLKDKTTLIIISIITVVVSLINLKFKINNDRKIRVFE